jgi:hypothetical protein
VRKVLAEQRVFTVKQLAVNGTDIMRRLGLPPGPAIGTILDALLQTALEDPALNEREKLLEIAEKLYRQRMAPR